MRGVVKLSLSRPPVKAWVGYPSTKKPQADPCGVMNSKVQAGGRPQPRLLRAGINLASTIIVHDRRVTHYSQVGPACSPNPGGAFFVGCSS